MWLYTVYVFILVISYKQSFHQSRNHADAGQVPDVLLRICAKTSFFDLSENDFDFTHEEEGGYTYLRDVVEHVHNFSDHKRLDLVNRSEYTGQFALGCKH